jgi:uncharacterized RDD family membrane protein YckC
MMRTWLKLVPLPLVLATTVSVSGQTATPPRPATPPAVGVEAAPPAVEAPIEPGHSTREVVRFGQDYRLRAGDEIGEAVIIGGSATIDGHVDRDLVVILGKVQLGSGAAIDGSLVVIGGGSAVVSPGARVGHDLVLIGSTVNAPPEFMPGGEQVVIGLGALGGVVDGILPWVTQGLFWGRPIVPSLPWVWGFVGICFLVYLAITFVFQRPVRMSAETLAERPLSAFVVGLLVLLLTAPVCLLLAVSVVGIVVVPFVLCSLLIAFIIGRVSTAHWIGMRIVGQEDGGDRLQSVRSFAIGFAVVCLAYMVPILGLIVWTTLGVFGLGATALAFITAYRSENPRVEPRVRVIAAAPPPPPVEPPSGPAPGAAMPGYVEASAFAPADSLPGLPSSSALIAFPRAQFRDRLAAFVLDVILVALAQHLLDLTRRDNAVFLLLLAYHIGFWTWKNTTVGGIICQLRLVRVDGSRLGFGDALVRGLSSIFSLAVVGIGCLWILKDPERQAWHDKIAGTYVVKVPRNWPH